MRIVVALALCALCACNPAAAPAPAAPELVLTHHHVPNGGAREVAFAINRVIGGEGMGASAVEGADRVVVVAPASVQQGVSGLIEELTSNAGAASSPRGVELTYWVVSGVPGDGSGEIPHGINDATVQAIRAHHGPQTLTLVGSRTLRSIAGEMAMAKTDGLEVEQRVAVAPDGATIVAELSIRDREGSSIDTVVRLHSDQMLVLGELGGRRDGPEGEHVYYIVRGVVTDG